MDKKSEIKKEYTAEEFATVYNKLCQEYGFAIKPELGYKPQIDGTFTIAVQLTVDKLPHK